MHQFGSTKYYPYGDCRNSQGNLGTDKLFTGQRLDETGLYYYGARYYDAEIGRFISADTVVQSPTNPQSLNRYSYVLNNPLKYTDPSGLRVAFENEDYILSMLEWEYYGYYIYLDEAMVQEWATLRYSWYLLSGVAPELTGTLESATALVTIQLSDKYALDATEQAKNYQNTGNIDILIGTGIKGDFKMIACVLAHEGFHAAEHIAGLSWQGKTTANEAFAYSLSYHVSEKLGYESAFARNVPLSAELSHINPFTDMGVLNKQVQQAGGKLFAYNPYSYGTTSPWSGKKVPMSNWPHWPFNIGKSRFLTVAQQVWIR